MACSSGVADSAMVLTLEDDRLPLHAQRIIDEMLNQSKWVAELPKDIDIGYKAVVFKQTAIQICITSIAYTMASLQVALEEPFTYFHRVNPLSFSKQEAMDDRLMVFASEPEPATKLSIAWKLGCSCKCITHRQRSPRHSIC